MTFNFVTLALIAGVMLILGFVFRFRKILRIALFSLVVALVFVVSLPVFFSISASKLTTLVWMVLWPLGFALFWSGVGRSYRRIFDALQPAEPSVFSRIAVFHTISCLAFLIAFQSPEDELPLGAQLAIFSVGIFGQVFAALLMQPLFKVLRRSQLLLPITSPLLPFLASYLMSIVHLLVLFSINLNS
ncbi:MAG: hypothetical protein JNM27_21330 [Leptospirales bacterium]|nr:hypothetical protein [Leptospirales bacterium]